MYVYLLRWKDSSFLIFVVEHLPLTPLLKWDRFSWVLSPEMHDHTTGSHCTYHKAETLRTDEISFSFADKKTTLLVKSKILVDKTLNYHYDHDHSYFTKIDLSYKFTMNVTYDGSLLPLVGEVFLRGSSLPANCRNCWQSNLKLAESMCRILCCRCSLARCQASKV